MPGPRKTLQRGIIILPSAFTLGNLFFGIYAMVSVSRGDFQWAGWCITIAGILDLLDGRVARLTRTGSAFGAQLDSLVDAISFGVAPGYVMFALFFADAEWSWVLSFVYITAVVVRLARFNMEQGGEARRQYHGLPSTAAGMALASFSPFSQTLFFSSYLRDLPWQQIMAVGMVLLSVLMVSHVPYSKVSKISLSTPRGLANSAILLAAVVAAVSVPEYFFFTVLVLYISWGLLKSVVLGFLDRIPSGDPLLDIEEGEVGSHSEVRDLDYGDLVPSGSVHLKFDSQSTPDPNLGLEE
ncbi:CDP-diacylglycerol--serine O-phosphatidyltransferase [Gemmatimonadales bacterium]|nr:CDP-diacylglycerol--serine O-phosphatidyltransferase [Gemmatimonadales bacterium]